MEQNRKPRNIYVCMGVYVCVCVCGTDRKM